jgi:hypothetical protein
MNEEGKIFKPTSSSIALKWHSWRIGKRGFRNKLGND